MALTCTPQSLEKLSACFDCGLTRKQLLAIESYIIAQAVTKIGLVNNATATSLLAAGKAFQALTNPQLEMVLIYLLVVLNNQLGVGGGLNLSSTPSGLMALAACFNCGLPKRLLLIIEVYVLSTLADGQGLVPGADPGSLIAAAVCFCYTPHVRESVIDYLLCNLSSS